MMGEAVHLDNYWKGKRAPLGEIKVPAYILASYSSSLHTPGSIKAYEEIAAPKWKGAHLTLTSR